MSKATVHNLAGTVFGRLTVLRFVPDDTKNARFLCRCSCGTEKLILVSALRSGSTVSCGCRQRDMYEGMRGRKDAPARNRIDMMGMRFGRLVVSGPGQPDSARKMRWPCVCDCGATGTFDAYRLRKGHATSCGCRQAELRKLGPNYRHGQTRSPTWNVWAGMRKRCLDTNCKKYPIYGGRGITICDRWDSFENFLADMGERPAGMTIERDDVNGNYGPNNCRWATLKEQANNRRNNHRVEYEGRIFTIAQLAELKGISSGSLAGRLRRGIPVDVAVVRGARC
jgi:hypothetical protein